MAKVQYKAKTGVLHIGGGRFFYAQKPVDVTDKELEMLKAYKDLEEVADKEQPEVPEQPDDSNTDKVGKTQKKASGK